MSDDGWFTFKQSFFWGGIASAIGAYFKYKIAQIGQKEVNMLKDTVATPVTGDSNIKAVLDGLNAVAQEIANVAKDGIQVKDAAQVVEDIIASPDFRAKLTVMVGDFKAAIEEAKHVDVIEGFDIAQYEYNGVKSIIDSLKK